MPRVSPETEISHIEFILGSGTGTLDFAIEGENSYYTWEGMEDDDWTVKNIQRIENAEEDRFIVWPEADYFTCEITLNEEGEEVVHCQ